MRLLIDQDEILAQWWKGVTKAWNFAYPKKLVTEVTTWDTAGVLGAGGETFIESLMSQKYFWYMLDPVPGALEGMKKLHDLGHELRIVTHVLPAFGGASYDGKIAWIKKHLPWFNLNHLHITRMKSEIKGDILFDDAPHQLQEFERGLAVALDYAWNRNVKCARVKSWGEFVKLVNSINGGILE